MKSFRAFEISIEFNPLLYVGQRNLKDKIEGVHQF